MGAAKHYFHIDVEEYPESVTGYIEKCIVDVTVIKSITIRANQKPWMTVKALKQLKIRDAALRSEDKVALRLARTDLQKGNFCDFGDTKCMREGIQAITDYRTTPQVEASDASLPHRLNEFYTRFKALNHTPVRKTDPHVDKQALSTVDVRKSFNAIIPQQPTEKLSLLGSKHLPL